MQAGGHAWSCMHVHLYAGGPGIQRVLDQLFDRCGQVQDDLAGADAVACCLVDGLDAAAAISTAAAAAVTAPAAAASCVGHASSDTSTHALA
eukprot:365664-Chlamydomonas_euryale.AAC.21